MPLPYTNRLTRVVYGRGEAGGQIVGQDRHKALSLQDERMVLGQDRHMALSLINFDNRMGNPCRDSASCLSSLGREDLGSL